MWEEGETNERYPWLEDEKPKSRVDGEPKQKPDVAVRHERYRGDDDRERLTVPPKYQKALDDARARHFAAEHFVSDNGTNYHHLTELTDEHLPELDFVRYHNLFAARTANAYLKTPRERPVRRQLFGYLWLEGELTLLFADTGLGKSALAVQMARALAGGEQIEPFAVTTGPQRVLYFDFELTDEQFAARYADADGNVDDPDDAEPLFPLGFIRCAPRHDAAKPDEFEDYYSFLIHSISDTISFSGARVVIVDNITWLSASTEHSAPAQRLMRTLAALKDELGLSILVIAHTPKLRPGSPIGLNHLQGSKVLANRADNVIAIGRSGSSRNLRYLKPLKQRNVEARFDERSVPVFRLEKIGRMLGFTFVDNEPETRHLDGFLRGHALAEAIRQDRMKRAIELSNAGDNLREIAEKLGVGLATVSSYLNKNGLDRGPNGKIAENADLCSGLFGSGASQTEQKSQFLDKKEVSSESPHQ